MSVYMIRKNGEYSTGGGYPSWMTMDSGKKWSSLGAARSAVSYKTNRERSSYRFYSSRAERDGTTVPAQQEPFYWGAHIVEVQLTEIGTRPAMEHIKT